MKKTTSVCSEKHQLLRLYFNYYAQNEIGFTFQNVDSIMQNVRRFSKVARKWISTENKKIGQLHHNESQYFIEDVYQKEVGKAELG